MLFTFTLNASLFFKSENFRFFKHFSFHEIKKDVNISLFKLKNKWYNRFRASINSKWYNTFVRQIIQSLWLDFSQFGLIFSQFGGTLSVNLV